MTFLLNDPVFITKESSNYDLRILSKITPSYNTFGNESDLRNPISEVKGDLSISCIAKFKTLSCRCNQAISGGNQNGFRKAQDQRRRKEQLALAEMSRRHITLKGARQEKIRLKKTPNGRFLKKGMESG